MTIRPLVCACLRVICRKRQAKGVVLGTNGVAARSGWTPRPAAEAAESLPVAHVGVTAPVPAQSDEWSYMRRLKTPRGGASIGELGPVHGRSVRSPSRDRTTVKCRRSRVAMSRMPSRSAVAITEASVVPSGRSR